MTILSRKTPANYDKPRAHNHKHNRLSTYGSNPAPGCRIDRNRVHHCRRAGNKTALLITDPLSGWGLLAAWRRNRYETSRIVACDLRASQLCNVAGSSAITPGSLVSSYGGAPGRRFWRRNTALDSRIGTGGVDEGTDAEDVDEVTDTEDATGRASDSGFDSRCRWLINVDTVLVRVPVDTSRGAH